MEQNIDPVSGNEVPPGASPKEVRDDIDAKLSEGEYVIPANVVRYFGVKFFENLLQRANKSLGEMEAGGRIQGKDELPFSDEELEFEEVPDEGPLKMAEGGFVPPGYTPPSYSPTSFDLTGLPSYTPGQVVGVPVVETKEFKGPSGETTTVLFINGQPATTIPEGYSEVSKTEAEKPTVQDLRVTQDTEDAAGEKRNYEENNKWARDPSEWSNEDISQLASGINSHINVANGIGLGLRMTSPIGGLVGKAVTAGTKDRIESALEEIDKRVSTGAMTLEEAEAARKGLQGGLTRLETKKAGLFSGLFNKEVTAPTVDRPGTGADWEKDRKATQAEYAKAAAGDPTAIGPDYDPYSDPTLFGDSSGGTQYDGNTKSDWSKSADEQPGSGGTKFAKGGLVQRRKKKKS